MLRGNALAKVDIKGRLKLPASFRSLVETTYGNEFFVTSLRGESARIYPLQVYAELEQRLAQASSVEPVVQRLRNNINYYGQSAVMDGQGRVLIHPLLREKAAIDGEVAVLGQQTFLEVWNRAQFEEQLGQNPLTDDHLRELATLGF